MSVNVVRVENLGKRFFLGQQLSSNLRQTLSDRFKARFMRGSGQKKHFWALKDVNFEINRGDVVGIIGRNGAGKSTLLKILSRITEPTTGKVELDGRVSSLLEVGTGFHSELTGRENIFLNGTILGMRRAEIKRKFDEIVSFSGVENFLDTPVKHYSSGMRVRLAFSVAAHLEPEILIIDEVLAVGDAEFQKKCLGKMDEVSKGDGRAIIFVSHNMSAVERLCTKGILLSDGEVLYEGAINDVIRAYLTTRDQFDNDGTRCREGICIKRFIFDDAVDFMGQANYEITISSPFKNRLTDLAILVYNDFQERVGIIDLRHKDLEARSALTHEVTIKGSIDSIPLIEGTYQLGLFLSSDLFRGDILDVKRLAVGAKSSEYVPYAARHRGYVQFKTDFIIE